VTVRAQSLYGPRHPAKESTVSDKNALQLLGLEGLTDSMRIATRPTGIGLQTTTSRTAIHPAKGQAEFHPATCTESQGWSERLEGSQTPRLSLRYDQRDPRVCASLARR